VLDDELVDQPASRSSASGYGLPGTKTLTPKGSADAARTAVISVAIASGVL